MPVTPVAGMVNSFCADDFGLLAIYRKIRDVRDASAWTFQID